MRDLASASTMNRPSIVLTTSSPSISYSLVISPPSLLDGFRCIRIRPLTLLSTCRPHIPSLQPFLRLDIGISCSLYHCDTVTSQILRFIASFALQHFKHSQPFSPSFFLYRDFHSQTFFSTEPLSSNPFSRDILRPNKDPLPLQSQHDSHHYHHQR
jgi:hypothetical protein